MLTSRREEIVKIQITGNSTRQTSVSSTNKSQERKKKKQNREGIYRLREI